MRARRIALAAAALALLAPASGEAGVAYGKHLYGQYCARCHDTANAPDLAGAGALAADFYLRTGYMPLPHLGVQPKRGLVQLSELQIRSLVAYVASLGPGPAIPHPRPQDGNLSEGQHLFATHCAGCHEITAIGGYVTDVVPPSLAPDSATEIAEAVRIGPNVMPRFSKRAISDAQLDSIVRYVEYVRRPRDSGGWSIGHLGPVPEGLVAWFVAMVALLVACLLAGRRLRS